VYSILADCVGTAFRRTNKTDEVPNMVRRGFTLIELLVVIAMMSLLTF